MFKEIVLAWNGWGGVVLLATTGLIAVLYLAYRYKQLCEDDDRVLNRHEYY